MSFPLQQEDQAVTTSPAFRGWHSLRHRSPTEFSWHGSVPSSHCHDLRRTNRIL